MSYKKKQHWYITSRSRHHHTNKPQNRNKHTRQNTILNHMGEKTKQATETCAVVTNAVPRQGAARCRLQRPPELLHQGAVTLKLHKLDRRSL
jgi:hypothetical protein